MSTILGLDLSLRKSGYCLLMNNEIKEIGTIKNDLRGIERLDYIIYFIQNNLLLPYSTSIELVAIEGYAYAVQQSRAHSTGELGGVVKLTLNSLNYKTIIVPPESLKKFATGKGQIKKNMVMTKVYKKYGLEFKNDDECDAYCLAKMGQAYLEGTEIKYEKEALKKVEVLT